MISVIQKRMTRLHGAEEKSNAMTTVFVSYRREETTDEARALFDELSTKPGKNSVFMDVDNIAVTLTFG